MTALREAEARFLAEVEAAPVYAVVPTGRTWAETWASDEDVVGRRALLAEGIARVVVSKGRGPVAERVVVA